LNEQVVYVGFLNAFSERNAMESNLPYLFAGYAATLEAMGIDELFGHGCGHVNLERGKEVIR
jgi:hypothetical protein